MMLSRLRDQSRHLLARIPPLMRCACTLCGANGNKILCDGCYTQFFNLPSHRCVRCATPLPRSQGQRDDECGACLQSAPSFDATIVAADYVPPIDQLVLALKFGSQLPLASLFAQLLVESMLKQKYLQYPDLLTATPLSSQRLSERGFNQALEIARPLARALNIKCDPLLVTRVRDTHAQSLLHPDQRRKNIRNAFSVLPAAQARLNGKHIAVVDDVITTGETLNELASTLKRFGAARVTNLVFARTLPR